MYTVWVGGTEVTDNYVTFGEAYLIYEKYRRKGYDDIIVQYERRK